MSLKQAISFSDHPVLILFYDKNSRDSKALAPYFEKMSNEFSRSYTFIKMDISTAEKSLTKRYKVTNAPSLVSLGWNGKHVKTYKGLESSVLFFEDCLDEFRLSSKIAEVED